MQLIYKIRFLPFLVWKTTEDRGWIGQSVMDCPSEIAIDNVEYYRNTILSIFNVIKEFDKA